LIPLEKLYSKVIKALSSITSQKLIGRRDIIRGLPRQSKRALDNVMGPYEQSQDTLY